MLRAMLIGLFSLFCLPTWATEGFHFEHKDWEIACDNTGTCRMVGYGWHDISYHSPEPSEPVSILFIREAGNKPIEGFIKIQYERIAHDNARIEDPSLWLNGKTLGKLVWQEEEIYKLTSSQTETLLRVLTGVPEIEVRGKLYGDDKRWFISSTGSTAVMKKMDEFQQRIDTPSALAETGKSDHPVLQVQLMPQIIKVDPTQDNQAEKFKATQETIRADDPRYARLLKLMQQYTNEEECFSLGMEGNVIKLNHFSPKYKLIGSVCANGPYEPSLFYMLTDLAEKNVFWYSPDYAVYEDGKLLGSYKLNDLGDCRLMGEAIWNGKTFVKSLQMSTGQCRGFAGGAWELPTFVSAVIEPHSTDNKALEKEKNVK